MWLVTGESDVILHMSDRSVAGLAETILRKVASAPNVIAERTAIVFNHRRKFSHAPLV